MMSEDAITYLWTWPQNFGNIFIDLGSIQSLKVAAPEYNINQVAGLSRVLFEDRRYGQKKNISRWIPKRVIKSLPYCGQMIEGRARNRFIKSILATDEQELKKMFKNYLDLSLHFNSKFVVLSGCIMDWYLIRQFGPTLVNLKDKGVKIVINGGGGSSYDERVIKEVKKFLKKLKPYAFISRDEVAFRNYQDLAQYAYNGIDCAFFISDYFKPAKLEIPPYYVFTFDRHPEPIIEIKDKLIVRTHHSHYCDPPQSYFAKPNTLISDLADDYLNLYANAAAVHSDRVHACVTSLSYGTPCKLYHRTSRALLFERVDAKEVTKELIHPNTAQIEMEKKKQLKFLSEVLEM